MKQQSSIASGVELALRVSLLLLAFVAALLSSASAGSPEGKNDIAGTWTAIIPDAFPDYVYTWTLNEDGTYAEDGHDARTGTPIQKTLTGRWSMEGTRLILRQDNVSFVFDGTLAGNQYWGRLYLDGRDLSQFCGARGSDAPEHCKNGGVADTAAPFRWASR